MVFVALADSAVIGKEAWEAPFGYVIEDVADGKASVVDKIDTRYGELWSIGPDEDGNKKIFNEDGIKYSEIVRQNGMKYLKTEYPGLSYLKKCVVGTFEEQPMIAANELDL